ncbi:MAG: DNRLRE domain-containing protein, partial [Sedimentisphaerales bacterium]|nr:DNRLRE domain-containing protein [Sedimentisphaerales bacterium]
MSRKLIYLISFILLLSAASSVQARTTATTADGNGADTYLSNDNQTGSGGSNGAPTATHGTEGSFAVRRNDGTRQRIGYIRFDISGITGSLTGATLSFNLSSSNRTRVWGIYGLVDETGDNWAESTTSYSNAPAFLSANLGYYAFDGTKLQKLGTMNIVNAAGIYTSNDVNLPLSTFIASDTNKLLTFVIIPDGTDTNASWYVTTREGSTALAPTLTFPNALRPPASYPNPANNTMVFSTTVPLQWQRGSYAAQHDIYFGSNWTDVNSATSSSPMGADKVYKARQSVDANNYTVTGLTYGTTYYWRIDEVRADGTTIDRGPTWRFQVLPQIAWSPTPSDNAMYVAPKMTLRWRAGSGAVTGHRVYLDKFTPPTTLIASLTAPRSDPNWTPGTGILNEYNKTYYWRVDEVDGGTTYPGSVWSFKTVPKGPPEPNLVGWWKLDEDVTDSGYGCDGNAIGNPAPTYVDGIFGSAIYLLGTTGAAPNQYVGLPINSVISTLRASTFAIWVFRFPTTGQKWHRIFDFGTGTTNYMFLAPWRSSSPPTHFEITMGGVTQRVSWGPYSDAGTSITADEWHHLAVTISEPNTVTGFRTFTLYVDGEPCGINTAATLTPSNLGVTTNNWLGRAQGWTGSLDPALFRGYLDDFRIYDRALASAEVKAIITPPWASNPSPANGATDVPLGAVSLS